MENLLRLPEIFKFTINNKWNHYSTFFFQTRNENNDPSFVTSKPLKKWSRFFFTHINKWSVSLHLRKILHLLFLKTPRDWSFFHLLYWNSRVGENRSEVFWLKGAVCLNVSMLGPWRCKKGQPHVGVELLFT